MVFQFARDAYYGSGFYHKRLHRKSPTRFFAVKGDPRTGDPSRGADVVNGRHLLAARALDLGSHPWDVPLRSDRAFAELHGFSWLRDLAALTGADARETAANLTRDWIYRWDHWHAATWAPGIIGARLSAWATHIDFLAGGPASAVLRDEIMITAAAQARHLAGLGVADQKDDDLFTVAAGLIAAGVALPDTDGLINAGLDRLEMAADQIQDDGGHVSRSPEIQAANLARLIECRQLLKAARLEPPVFLNDAIAIMAQALKTLMHGDGGLALFNGGTTGHRVDLSAIISASGARGSAPSSLAETGFERLSAGTTVIIADTGPGNGTPQEAAGYDKTRTAGALSFEMSVGRHRLVVNCGAHPDETTEWSRVLRATAAHSTLTVNDTDALPLRTGGVNPGQTGRRNERHGSQLIQLSHNGYQPQFGIVHNRDLYLSKDGDDFRGKDVLVGGAGAFAIRFHLHPDVSASLLEGGAAILIKFGKGQGWRFRSAGADIDLEESVYMGDPARPRRCQQIVLRGETSSGEATVRWSFLSEPT